VNPRTDILPILKQVVCMSDMHYSIIGELEAHIQIVLMTLQTEGKYGCLHGTI